MTEEIEVVFKEPKSFREILKPMIYFSWIMGTGVCRPGDWKKVTIFLKIFHFMMCSGLVASGIIDYFKIGSVIKGETYKMIYYTNKAVTYLTSYYYVFFGIFYYKKWLKFVGKFDSLEKKMRREITIDDRSAKIHQIIAFSVIVLIGPISIIAHIVYYYFTNLENLVASDILLYYIITQSLTTNFGFDIMVCRIYQRFKIVNQLIKQIGDSYTAPWIVLKIHRLRELHYGICRLVNILNNAYGIHLLLGSANSFMVVVSMLFRIYLGVNKCEYDFILSNNAIWIIYAVQFAVNCSVCTMTAKEAKKTGIFIHDVGLKNNQLTNKRFYNNHPGNRRSLNYQTETNKTHDGSSVQNEISYFSSQLEQNPVAFRPCQFFILNNELFLGFIGVITTYLIILIQFNHDTDECDSQCPRPHNITCVTNATKHYYTTMNTEDYTM